MAERDEEGRPVATRNAGAFLAPYSGVLPVPSSIIDQTGASVEHVAEADIERRGQQEAAPRRAVGSSVHVTRWLLAWSTAIAVWALCHGGMLVLLEAATWVTERSGETAATNLLASLGDPVARIGAAAAFLALGVRIGATFLSDRTIRAWLVLGLSTLLGVLIVGSLMLESRALESAVVCIAALVWLALAYQLRPL